MAMCRFDGDDGNIDRVAGVLETFLVSLSLLIGDDVRAAKEAQMLRHHTTTATTPTVPISQFSQGKGDIGIVGPSSETDVISLGLLLNSMVTNATISNSSG